MLKKIIITFAVVFFAGFSAVGRAVAAENKYLIIFADYGNNPPPADVISVVAGSPGLKVTFAWPGRLKLPEKIVPLVKEKKVELALAFEDEPLMPLVYNTEISTPVAINYSWPEDVWNMVFRAKDELYQNTQVQAKGMYLRSGLFSTPVARGLKRLGIYWSNYDASDVQNRGVFLADGFLALSPQKKNFANALECWKWINSSPEQFLVLDFGGSRPLSAEFLRTLAGLVRQTDSVKTVTPEIVLSKLKGKVSDIGGKSIDTDLSNWSRFPLVWYELSVVRKTIEDYKNSGSAKLSTLDKLRDQLYGLYGFRLIDNIVKNPSKENQDAFQKGISNIYSILNLPVDESIKTLPGIQQLRPFSMEISSQSLVIVNSESSKAAKNISQLVVTLSLESVTYFVDLGTETVQAPFIVDIYMDLNNQEGAGLTKLLPGLDCFLEVNDAWEYALRIEKDKATLFRAGRFDPVQIKQFNMQMPWELEIPRNILRGNPLLWGYQVITAIQKADGSGYDVNDFLAKDDEVRQRLLNVTTMQLPAVRALRARQGKLSQ